MTVTEKITIATAVRGFAGDVRVAVLWPPGLFCGERFVAWDTADPPGFGTRVGAIRVAGRPQRPAGAATTATFLFGPTSLDSELRLDPCPPGSTVEVDVHFDRDCEFRVSVSGQIVRPGSDGEDRR